MGTNFYLMAQEAACPECKRPYDKPKKVEGEHVGKRSAAGYYCWDCNRTLNKGGLAGVHQSGFGFWDACPNCGKKRPDEDITAGAAGRELGFNKSPPQKKQGVASCSSFTWAIQPSELDKLDSKSLALVIVDEYGHEFTLAEFKQVLTECPIQYLDSIGRDFS